MIYGEDALQLIRELKRSKWLPAYNATSVQKVIAEISSLHILLEQSLQACEDDEDSPQVACGAILNFESIKFNKRCIIAYLTNRIDTLKKTWWEMGNFIPEELNSKLGPTEVAFLDQYGSVVRNYMQSIDADLNLDQEPPKDLFIEVRVLKPCGTIHTESGTIKLDENTTHLVRRRDVELLIRQGALQQIS